MGGRAEATIREFRRLNSVFALSLRPHAPKPETKHKLLAKIRESISQEQAPEQSDADHLFPNHTA